MKIKSIKYNEDFEGSLDDAIDRASKINDAYQPAFGVQIEDEAGNTIWDTEEANVTRIAARMFREEHSGGNYLLRNIPEQLKIAMGVRAAQERTNMRAVVLAALEDYLK